MRWCRSTRFIDAVAAGKFDAGLIIHEGQLTFQNQGLPHPSHRPQACGGRRRPGCRFRWVGTSFAKTSANSTMKEVSRLIRASIKYGLDHREEALKHALQYARDMDVKLADKFVGHVREPLDARLWRARRAAIRRLLEEAHKAKIIPNPVELEFVE